MCALTRTVPEMCRTNVCEITSADEPVQTGLVHRHSHVSQVSVFVRTPTGVRVFVCTYRD